jgi:hypothetical protein
VRYAYINGFPQGSVCDECGKAQKSASIEECSQHTGYVSKRTEWLIAIHLAGEHGSGKINYFLPVYLTTVKPRIKVFLREKWI